MQPPRFHRIAAIALMGLALHGCSSGGLNLFATGRSIAAGAGVDHTTSGIAYKIFTASTDELRVATLDTLRRMDLAVVKDGLRNNAYAIVATAKQRRIEIEIEALSSRTTRMRVVANEGEIFFKDAATATEIIVQTAATLDGLTQRHQETG